MSATLVNLASSDRPLIPLMDEIAGIESRTRTSLVRHAILEYAKANYPEQYAAHMDRKNKGKKK